MATDWTEHLHNREAVLGLYGSPPSLSGFAVHALTFSHGFESATLHGDLASLPDPVPKRWAERGKVRAACEIRMGELVGLAVEGSGGVFRSAVDGRLADLSIGSAGRTVRRLVTVLSEDRQTAEHKEMEFPVIVVKGAGEEVGFEIECVWLDMFVRGRTEREP